MTDSGHTFPDKLVSSAVELLSRTGTHGTVSVCGRSMMPTLRQGQEIAVEFGAGRLRKGDVLLFRREDFLTVHRLLGSAQSAERGVYYRTRGDGVLELDPPVLPDDVVGRITAVHVDDEWRDLRSPFGRTYGWLVAWHDLGWAILGTAARRLDAKLGTAWRGRVRRMDRGLLRMAHRILFRFCHPLRSDDGQRATK